MINDGVKQRISEVIRSGSANPAFATADSCPHRFEDVEVCLLLQGNEKGLTQKHAYLFTTDFPVLGQVDHLCDDKKIVIVLFDLGSLGRLQHIFERQGMEIEPFPENPEDAEVTESIDIDPGHQLIIQMLEELIATRIFSFFQTIRAVLNQSNHRGDLRHVFW